MRTLIHALLLTASLLFIAACAPAPQTGAPVGTFTTISVGDLKARLDAGEQLLVLDVRTPEEYSQDGHIAGSTLLPIQELSQRLDELEKDQPIACFCRSGNRSRTACTQLAQAGFTNLVNVDGGIVAWKAASYPVE